MPQVDLPVRINTARTVLPNLSVYYPLVEGLPNMVAQQTINYRIQALVNQLIRDQGYYQNPQTEVTGTYEIKTNERGILSLNIINYAFAGGAHGLTITKSLTFDVQTGRVYELKDLFKPGSDYVKRLNQIIEKQIAERKIPLLNPFTGIKADQDFYIADKALVIYFQLYELTAYVYGFTYFPISVYEIEDIIDENGPLGKMIY
ncbi:MAG: DUF3298 domain-containing protein [Clostridia bacterium]|nr:DUF3298 domain-containing protein [Clostridia bacterium]